MKKIGIKQITIVTAFLAFTLLLMFPTENVFAQNNVPPSASITSSTPVIPQDGYLTIPAGQTTITVRFDYRGTDPDDNLLEFRCSLDGAAYLRSTCPMPTPPPTNTHSMTGSKTLILPPGQHTFGVKVVSDHRNVALDSPQRISVASAPDSLRSFTVEPSTIDATVAPIPSIYKAYSSSPDYRYHTDHGHIGLLVVTQYNNMYVVFDAFYRRATGSIVSDIFGLDGVRTTFQCRWDTATTFTDCGRFNTLTRVTPGFHQVEIKARNAGLSQGSYVFEWCYAPNLDCTNSRPPSWQPLTMQDVRSYISEEDVKFTTGKNETIPIKDVKEFLIPKISTDSDAKNVTIYLKSPVVNETISAKNTFQNMTIGANATNVTSLGLKDSQVFNARNMSLADTK